MAETPTCGYGAVLSEQTLPGVEVSGFNIGPSACPNCGRLFPLSRADARPAFVVHCNRTDPHPAHGEHWYEHGPIRITFNVDTTQVWIA